MIEAHPRTRLSVTVLRDHLSSFPQAVRCNRTTTGTDNLFHPQIIHIVEVACFVCRAGIYLGKPSNGVVLIRMHTIVGQITGRIVCIRQRGALSDSLYPIVRNSGGRSGLLLQLNALNL
jgi:hypothetical protein